jgi:glycosyltransferase involved in cell wall biosynthesis
MKLIHIVLSYNRPKVLARCLSTLINNTEIKPDEIWVLDDGSEAGLRKGLVEFVNTYSTPQLPINVVLCGRNYGIGWAFENAYNIIKWKNPEVVGIIEADYIWRKGYMEDIMAVFAASPHTVAIPGYDHPDMYDQHKLNNTFPEIMKEQFGSDVEARPYFYKPFDLPTSLGNIKVQGVSNSCGCHFLNWKRVNELLLTTHDKNDEFWHWMDRAFHKWGVTDRSRASDGHISGTLTFLWERWAKLANIDITKNFAWLDICDHSIGQHLCGLGINGHLPGMQEGMTFVGSPHWPEAPDTFKR